MKKILSLIIALISGTLSYAQIDSKLDINGEYQTVVEIKDSTINLYKKTKEWIVSSYINPKEVIVADEENQYIKISALQPESTTNGLANPAFYYTLTIEFKEGRYRLTYNITKLYNTGQYSSTWTYISYFNINKGIVRPMNEAKVQRIKNIIDELLNSQYNFIINKVESTNSDW